MVDILANGAFGRDDGVKCDCGGKTFLTADQGGGLKSYECETCGDSFQVQFEREEPYESDDDYYEPPYECVDVEL